MPKRTVLAIALILFILMTTLSASVLAAPMAEVIANATATNNTIEQGGIIETMLAGIINNLSDVLRMTGLMPISTMLYNIAPAPGADQQWVIEQSRWDQWMLRDDQWMRFAAPAYSAFMTVAIGLLMLTFISGGMKLSIHAGSPHARAKAANNVLFWLIGSVLFFTLPALINVLLDINRGLVSVAAGLVGADLIQTMDARLFGTGGVVTGNILLTALVNLAFVVLMLWFNVIFFIRWFVVTALFSIAPLGIWTWMKGQQSSFFLWLGELISNILMQFVYALVFGMALLILMSPDLERNWLINLVTLTLIIPVTKLLRAMITQWLNIIGLDEEGQARSVVGGGIGSLASVGSAITGSRKASSRPNTSTGGGGGGGGGGNFGGGNTGSRTGSGWVSDRAGSDGTGGGGSGTGGGAGGGASTGGGGGSVLSRAGSIMGKTAALGTGVLTAAALAPVTGWGDAGKLGKSVAGGVHGATSKAGSYMSASLGKLRDPKPDDKKSSTPGGKETPYFGFDFEFKPATENSPSAAHSAPNDTTPNSSGDRLVEDIFEGSGGQGQDSSYEYPGNRYSDNSSSNRKETSYFELKPATEKPPSATDSAPDVIYPFPIGASAPASPRPIQTTLWDHADIHR